MQNKIVILTLLLVANVAAAAQVAQNVDPLLGTDGGGNTFPGPSVPFGMIKPGPDMGDNTGNAGWQPNGDINGFSQTHVSGTGGGDKYGNILVQPTVGDPRANGFASPSHEEQASAGYYRVTLTRYPIDVEITTARRTALYRFTYPAAGQRNIQFDVSHVLSASAEQGEGQTTVRSAIRILSPNEVTGSTTVTGGWNKQTTSYTVYFYAVTDVPAASWGTWLGDAMHPGSQKEEGGASVPDGAWLTLPGRQNRVVNLKLAISFISEAQAKQNAIGEVFGLDFDGTRARTVAAWDKALSAIGIQGASKEDKQIFYTALYHTMLMPVDRTGENPLWQSKEPYYDDFYTIWDTFRTSSPLLSLVAPEREAQIVRALIDIYRHDGWLPDGRSGNFNGRTQGGSDGEFVLTDAYLHRLPGIDWATAYAAMVKDAEVTPKDQIKEGRGDLEDWKTLHYLSIEGVDRPASKTMEYAADDFEVAEMAQALHHQADYAKYIDRSRYWENLWDQDAVADGFRGFIWPRHRDGAWKTPFNALESGSWGGDNFYEGNSWTYSTFVPQDVAELIRRCGGPEVFVKRLDAFFAVPGRYDVGNEPGFLSPYLYAWAGRQDRTADQIRSILASSYHAGRKGLPGNDDSGAMSSWYVFGKMGFFPNAGQDVYIIGSPAFAETAIHLANGKTFTIVAKGVSAQNRYIAHAEWNGRPYTQAWFRIGDLMKGGRLVLTMSATPSSWATGALPPSPADLAQSQQ
jgi:predicted alpha-1,2-mannosidase